MKDGLYIAFNPQFLADAFSIVDSDKPVCIGTNAKSPMLITGNEYSFLVLPINITSDCYGITFRLVCFDFYEKLMAKGYVGQYYTAAVECIDYDY